MKLFLRIIKAAVSLLAFSFGVTMTVQANIGVGPWDVFALGVANKTPLSYGDVATIVSFTVLILCVILKEKIGLGTILDMCITGKGVDLFTWLNIIPKQTNVFSGVAMFIGGLIIMAICVYLYMSTRLGCGPRDSLMLALSRRLTKIPIGIVRVMLEAIVLLIGWLLDGPVGIGTLISVFGLGLLIQLVFKIVHYDADNVIHESVADTLHIKLQKTK